MTMKNLRPSNLDLAIVEFRGGALHALEWVTIHPEKLKN